MTLFVAGKRQIDVIRLQQDTSGDVSFSKKDGLYRMDDDVVVPDNHEISIGSGR
jgi:hypothetical protein